jgi:hypothetical protein
MTQNNCSKINIRVTTSHYTPIIRQTPGRKGHWGNCSFAVNTNLGNADWWVVSSGLRQSEECLCDPRNTVFIANEPPAVKYRPGFLKQFAHVITCDRSLDHPGKIHGPYGIPWWAGLQMDVTRPHYFAPEARFGYDELSDLKPPAKPKKMSVITSRLQMLDGHKKRSSFVAGLKAAMGKDIDFFGYDSVALSDKWDGLEPYRYHLCIENAICPDYWTEKIADPLLAFCLPIYCGCPNMSEYLPSRSFIPINIDNEAEAIATIEKLIITDPYTHHLEHILKARRLLLDKYNFFAILAEICKVPANVKQSVVLHPNHHFPRWRFYAGKLKRSGKQMAQHVFSNLIPNRKL